MSGFYCINYKKIRKILLVGQLIKVYTDYKNLWHKTFDTVGIVRWRLILEEYNLEATNTRGSKYITVGALSRLDIVDTNNATKPNMSSLVERFSLEKEDVPHLVDYKKIIQYQQYDESLIEAAESNKDYSIKNLHRTDQKFSLICRKHKIVIY